MTTLFRHNSTRPTCKGLNWFVAYQSSSDSLEQFISTWQINFIFFNSCVRTADGKERRQADKFVHIFVMDTARKFMFCFVFLQQTDTLYALEPTR